MTRFLLDINVLIALIDPAHVQHDRAHEWFAASGKKAWATSTLTENCLLRIEVMPDTRTLRALPPQLPSCWHPCALCPAMNSGRTR